MEMSQAQLAAQIAEQALAGNVEQEAGADQTEDEAGNQQQAETEQEQEQQQQEEQPQTFAVTIGGEEREIPIQELVDNFAYRGELLAQQDAFNRRYEERVAGILQQSEQYSGRLEQVAQILEALAPKMPNLKDLPPEQVAGAIERWEKQQKLLESVKGQAKQENERRQALQQQRMQQRLEQENTLLLAAIPEWRDPAKREAEIGEIQSFMQRTIGYTAEELGGASYDHRNLILFRLAMIGQRAVKAGGSITAEGTQPGPNDGRGGTGMSDADHDRIAKQLRAKAQAPGATQDDRIAYWRHMQPNVWGPAPE